MFDATQPTLSINTTDISSLVGIVFEFFANPNKNNHLLIQKNIKTLTEVNNSVEKLKNWAWQNTSIKYSKQQFQKAQEIEKVVEIIYKSLALVMKNNTLQPIQIFLQKFEELLKNLQAYLSIMENDLKNEQIQKELKTLTNRRFDIV